VAAVVGPQRSSKKAVAGFRRKKARSNVHIDMTPMVDIAFLLLIFFMVTTVFRSPQTMELNLPPEDSEVEIAESNVLVIRMLEDGRVFWNIGKMEPEAVEFPEIQKLILDKDKENAENHNGESKLVTLIKIHRSSPYEQMVNVMDELQLGKIDRFSITVMEDKEVREVFGL
jgi:biopolymer transport protein ExbD